MLGVDGPSVRLRLRRQTLCPALGVLAGRVAFWLVNRALYLTHAGTAQWPGANFILFPSGDKVGAVCWAGLALIAARKKSRRHCYACLAPCSLHTPAPRAFPGTSRLPPGCPP